MKPGIYFLLAITQYNGVEPFLLKPYSVKSKIPMHLRVATTSKTEESTTTLLPAEITIDATRKVAVESLEKLLSQQKSELRETERLLQLLQSSAEKPLDLSEADTTLSTAASILSGFDYGFLSRSEGAPSQLKPGVTIDGLGYGGPPANILTLGIGQFMRNLNAMKGEYKDEEDVVLTPKQKILRAKLEELTLNSTAIWERELADGPIDAPFVIKIPYLVVCYMLDVLFEGKYVPSRFLLLETVARMPYFSYISMLHLYETLGFWRRSADMKRVHFAEELNEYRHLLIMESLGGDQKWWVRFLAQHSAIVYFYILCFLWALSPSLSYRFSELLETHAVNTYSVFIEENEKLLKELPPSMAAVEYYSFGSSDSYYAEFQTTAISEGREIRRPGSKMQSLYDVFQAIRNDEGDHASTMHACLDPSVSVRSPSLEKKILTGIATVAAISALITAGGGSQTILDGILGETGDFTSEALLGSAVGMASQAAEESGLFSQVGKLVEGGASLEGTFEGLLQVLLRFLAVFL